ncbi:MAG: hypothetical protein AB7F22_31065 [Reyranella sp.]
MGDRAKPKRHLSEAYKYPGFRPRATIREVEGDAGTLIVSLERRSKKPDAAAAAKSVGAGMTVGNGACVILAVADIGLFWSSTRAVSTAGVVAG